MSFGESLHICELVLALSGASQTAVLRPSTDNFTNINIACRLSLQYWSQRNSYKILPSSGAFLLKSFKPCTNIHSVMKFIWGNSSSWSYRWEKGLRKISFPPYNVLRQGFVITEISVGGNTQPGGTNHVPLDLTVPIFNIKVIPNFWVIVTEPEICTFPARSVLLTSLSPVHLAGIFGAAEVWVPIPASRISWSWQPPQQLVAAGG